MAETAYIVLRREDEEGKQIGDFLNWTVVGRSDARTPNSAIRDIAANLLEGKSGIFVAVPERSWNPTTVTAATQIVIKFGQPPAASPGSS